jgi:hypothetical protein
MMLALLASLEVAESAYPSALASYIKINLYGCVSAEGWFVDKVDVHLPGPHAAQLNAPFFAAGSATFARRAASWN